MSRRFNFILNRFIFWIEFDEKFDSKYRNSTQNAEFWGFWTKFLHFESNFWANSIQKLNRINAIESIAKVQFESLVMITKKYWIVTALFLNWFLNDTWVHEWFYLWTLMKSTWISCLPEWPIYRPMFCHLPMFLSFTVSVFIADHMAQIATLLVARCALSCPACPSETREWPLFSPLWSPD